MEDREQKREKVRKKERKKEMNKKRRKERNFHLIVGVNYVNYIKWTCKG